MHKELRQGNRLGVLPLRRHPSWPIPRYPVGPFAFDADGTRPLPRQPTAASPSLHTTRSPHEEAEARLTSEAQGTDGTDINYVSACHQCTVEAPTHASQTTVVPTILPNRFRLLIPDAQTPILSGSRARGLGDTDAGFPARAARPSAQLSVRSGVICIRL